MLKSKSILHVTTVHRPNDNRIYYKECRSLKAHFARVDLYSTHPFNGTPSEVQHIQHKGARNRFLRMIFVSFFGVLKNTIFTKYDLYHFHDPEIIPAALVLRMMGKKVIYDAHENLPGAIMSKAYLHPRLRRLASKIIATLEGGAAPFFNAVITARPDIAEYMRNKNVIVLRNLPELPSSRPSLHRTESGLAKIIYTGGITPIRGIRELIQSMQFVPNATLLLLGPFEASFKAECEKLPGWQNVQYLGIVNADKVLDIVSQADVGVITFLPEPNHVTTLATKPFEYMACGLPVVMSHFKYWKDFFKDSAIYVDPSDPRDVAKGINTLLSDKVLREAMGTRNQKIIFEELNWEKESEKLIALYSNLLDTNY